MRMSLAEKKLLVRVECLARSVGHDLLTTEDEMSLARKLEAQGLLTLQLSAGSYLQAVPTEDGREKAARVRKEVNRVEAQERMEAEKRRQAERRDKRPCLVNVLTGERYYGEPGESEDALFGRLANF